MNRTATRIARRFIAVALQPLVEKHFGSLDIDSRKLTKHLILMTLSHVDNDLKDIRDHSGSSDWEFDYQGRKTSEYGSVGGYAKGHHGDPQYEWDSEVEYEHPDPALADIDLEYKARDLVKPWTANLQRMSRDRLALRAAILGFLRDPEAMKVLGISVGQKVKDALDNPKFWMTDIKFDGPLWSYLYEDDGIETYDGDPNDLKITAVKPKTTFKVKPLSQGGFKLILHSVIGLDGEVTDVTLKDDDYDGPDEPYIDPDWEPRWAP
jgi:hypothetical protein